MQYTRPVTGARDWFATPPKEANSTASLRITPQFRRELGILAETHNSNYTTILAGLVAKGLEAYGEELDRFAKAQDDLAERLERLGYDDDAINQLFERFVDLAELDSLVAKMEAKKR